MNDGWWQASQTQRVPDAASQTQLSWVNCRGNMNDGWWQASQTQRVPDAASQTQLSWKHERWVMTGVPDAASQTQRPRHRLESNPRPSAVIQCFRPTQKYWFLIKEKLILTRPSGIISGVEFYGRGRGPSLSLCWGIVMFLITVLGPKSIKLIKLNQ